MMAVTRSRFARSGFAWSLCWLTLMQSSFAERSGPNLSGPNLEALYPEAVLAASAQHHPQIAAAIARHQQAAGDALAAQGEFDTTFSSTSRARLSGFWDGRFSDNQISRQLSGFGARIYGNYRVSGGSFPIYEDESFTNELGELKAGVLVSLLRDRTIDARRFSVSDATLAEEQAQQDLLLARVSVQRRALIAYWRWVTQGYQLRVYEDLLRIARQREKGLQAQVESGARAKIELVENRQNLIRRKELVTISRRGFETAAVQLSLFYRDIGGQPIIAHPDQLPLNADTLVGSLSRGKPAANPAGSIGPAPDLSARPELRKLQTAIERVRRDIELRRNNLRPRLDFGVELARDLGSVAEGGLSRSGTDTIVSLTFNLPLQRRAARGKLAQSEAKLTELQQQLRLTQDQLRSEIQSLLLQLDATRELVGLVEEEVEQAQLLQRAEQQRFANGASDFFLVNLREQAAADAWVRYHRVRFDAAVAQVSYDAAIINLQRLQLEF